MKCIANAPLHKERHYCNNEIENEFVQVTLQGSYLWWFFFFDGHNCAVLCVT
jgi:hypothetical protein